MLRVNHFPRLHEELAEMQRLADIAIAVLDAAGLERDATAEDVLAWLRVSPEDEVVAEAPKKPVVEPGCFPSPKWGIGDGATLIYEDERFPCIVVGPLSEGRVKLNLVGLAEGPYQKAIGTYDALVKREDRLDLPLGKEWTGERWKGWTPK